MISDLLDTTPDAAASDELRLTMTPDGEGQDHVDGVWWPRTTDAAAEFPALIGAMSAGGPIHRVSYHLDRWDHVDRRLAVGSKLVRMEGFHAMPPDTVTLIRLDDTRIELVVVPPDTPRDAAAAALRAEPAAR